MAGGQLVLLAVTHLACIVGAAMAMWVVVTYRHERTDRRRREDTRP